MIVWAVANQKGGVGKTTSVITLGGLLAQAGKRVLMLDIDPHGSLTSYMGSDPDSVERGSYNLFQLAGKLVPDDVLPLIHPTEFPNLSLMRASSALATLERQMVGKDGMGLKISQGLAQLADHYDHVLIDSPPVVGVLMINALAASNHLIVPVQTEFLALKGLERMVRTLDMVIRAQKSSLDYTIVPTMFDRRTQASVSSLRKLRNTYTEKIWPSMIPIDTRFRDASSAGVPPASFDSESRGVASYRSLLKYLLSKEHNGVKQRASA